MPGFRISGEQPEIGPEDSIEMVDEIARYDLVAFERADPGLVHIRVVRPQEFPTFEGNIYQIDRAEEDDTFELRQVRIQFWPW